MYIHMCEHECAVGAVSTVTETGRMLQQVKQKEGESVKKIMEDDKDVSPAGGKHSSISSVKIWKCLTGFYAVLHSLTGASTVYHQHYLHVFSCHFYVSRLTRGELEGPERVENKWPREEEGV